MIGQAVMKQSGKFPCEAAIIRFLALTGARRGEALALQWSDINGNCAALRDSKTGPKAIWLAAPVRDMLQELRLTASGPYVFGVGSQATKCHRVEHVWRVALRSAGLCGIRLHDLRHGFASVGVSNGEDLRTIAGLLGHADFSTTLNYAHLAAAPVEAAAQRVSETLARALRSKRPTTSERQPARPYGLSENGWTRHVNAYRRQPLRLVEFCVLRQLDPSAFHKALLRLNDRRRRALKATAK